jgi:hypothetical protein
VGAPLQSRDDDGIHGMEASPHRLQGRILRQVSSRGRWWQQSFGTFKGSLSLTSRRVVRRWMRLSNRRRYGSWGKQFDIGDVACLPEVFCYCTIMLRRILLPPRRFCYRPGGGNVFPTHVQPWLSPLGLPRAWQTEEIYPRPAIFILQHRQSQGSEVA